MILPHWHWKKIKGSPKKLSICFLPSSWFARRLGRWITFGKLDPDMGYCLNVGG